jgi:hypothetical protein
MTQSPNAGSFAAILLPFARQSGVTAPASEDSELRDGFEREVAVEDLPHDHGSLRMNDVVFVAWSRS